MPTSTSSPFVQSPAKSSSFSGCLLTALAILFAVLGVYRLIWGSTIAYVFSATGMLSLFNIGIVLLIICQCLIFLGIILE